MGEYLCTCEVHVLSMTELGIVWVRRAIVGLLVEDREFMGIEVAEHMSSLGRGMKPIHWNVATRAVYS